MLNCPLHSEAVVMGWSAWLPCGCPQEPWERYLQWPGGDTTGAQWKGQELKEQLACNTDFLHSVVFTSSVTGAVIRGGWGWQVCLARAASHPRFSWGN